MSWSKRIRSEEHKLRTQALSAAISPAYRSSEGLPLQRMDLGQTGRRATREGRAGSRGGAPIWVAKKGWEPEDMRPGSRIAAKRMLEGRRWAPGASDQDGHYDNADPDGFAVFGRYPKGFLAHVVKAQWLGRVQRHNILHVCSGTLSESEPMTVDLRAEARPWVQASGTALPFKDGTFKAVMLDPPYSDEYAKNLYRVENPRPSWLLKEAARVLMSGARLGILHVAIPFAPPGCRLVDVWPVTTGVGFRIRAFTVYEKHQAGLW